MSKRTAREENVRTLAELAGVPPDKAQELLTASVVVTAGRTPADTAAAAELNQLLSMTLIAPIGTGSPPQLEVIIGDIAPVTAAPKLFVTFSELGFKIRETPAAELKVDPKSHFVVLLAAQYTTGQVFLRIFGDMIRIPPATEVSLDLSELLGGDIECLFDHVLLRQFHQAGTGAIGTWFLHALKAVGNKITGRAILCDGDKFISDGNLQRYALVSKADIGAGKTARIAELAQGSFSNLELVPFNQRVQELKYDPAHTKTQIERLVVTVDSRRARRELQNELPAEVFDASTTGAKEIILHFNSRPVEKACLSCVYPEDPIETAERKHIAEALGIPVSFLAEDVISAEAAKLILKKYPDLSASPLLGVPYSTLFKQLCGQQKLVAEGEKAVLTPFAFVSAMAGTYLAIEFLRRSRRNDALAGGYNFWRLSPWRSPLIGLRRMLGVAAGCELHNDRSKLMVAKKVWKTE